MSNTKKILIALVVLIVILLIAFVAFARPACGCEIPKRKDASGDIKNWPKNCDWSKEDCKQQQKDACAKAKKCWGADDVGSPWCYSC